MRSRCAQDQRKGLGDDHGGMTQSARIVMSIPADPSASCAREIAHLLRNATLNTQQRAPE